MSSATAVMAATESRQGLLDPAEFLKNTHIKSVIEGKIKSGFALLTIDEYATVDAAMKLLGDNNFQAVPVKSRDGSIRAFLTQIELVNFCLSIAMDASTVDTESHGNVTTLARDVQRLKEQAERSFAKTTVGSLVAKASSKNWLPMTSEWVVIDWNESVLNACERYFVQGYRRVAVLDDYENVCGILTQSDVISLLARSAESTPETAPLGIFQSMPLQQYLGDEFDKCYNNLVTISWNAPVMHAFCTTTVLDVLLCGELTPPYFIDMMFEKNVPCIIVTDERGLPMSIVSASDVRRFNRTNLDLLLKSVGDFTSGYEYIAAGPPVSVTAMDAAGSAFSQMVLYGIHQVILKDDSGIAIGVIPMSLLLRPIVRMEKQRREQATRTSGAQTEPARQASEKQTTEKKQEIRAEEAGGEPEVLPIPTNS